MIYLLHLLPSLLMFIDPVSPAGPKLIAPAAKGTAKTVARGGWSPGDVILTVAACVLVTIILVAVIYGLVKRWNRNGNLIASPAARSAAAQFADQPPTFQSRRRSSLITPMDEAIAADLERDRALDGLEAARREWARRRNFHVGEDAPEAK